MGYQAQRKNGTMNSEKDQPNRFLQTRLRIVREARELGITVTPEQVDLCTIILFSIQQDEELKLGGKDGNSREAQ
jgi:hypothetical protein